MTVRLRTIWDVRAFSITLTAFVMLGSLALQYLFLPTEIAREIRWQGMLISFVLAAPLTYFSGRLMYDIDRLNTDIKQAARHDPLTGLLNRHAFIEQIRHAAQLPGVIIMADIDHFKDYNDMHGHAMGDAALKHVARVFLYSCRIEDLTARYGGEEFMVFLPNISLEDGVKVAERIRHRLATEPMTQRGISLSITASFGVAVLKHSDDTERTIAKADAALYRSKNEGRNRVSAAAEG